jgi:hypothetical protein
MGCHLVGSPSAGGETVRLSVEQILGELKGFQRDAVDHVMDRLYETERPGRRFLIADETGLGKSVIARGIIARAIERLESDSSVDRIDIVYVCSNADLAQQNLKRLNVTGEKHLAMTSRLTLLARETSHLARARSEGRKVVNLVSFTPGTSFDMGWRTGSADERALLHVLLAEQLKFDEFEDSASRMLLKGGVHDPDRFAWIVDKTRRALGGPVSKEIAKSFMTGAREGGLIREYKKLVRRARGDRFPDNHTIRELTGKLRAELARASVETLEPDLVILDEFQRFRHLLDLEHGGEAAVLAHHLFDYEAAKVLLLSATPYKPYTGPNDAGGDDHYRDLMTTLSFLAEGSSNVLAGVRGDFAAYRDSILSGGSGADEARRLRSTLLNLMSRTERPQTSEADQIVEHRRSTGIPNGRELAAFVGLQQLAKDLGVAITIEYWKSIPHFAHFMETYVAHRVLDDRFDDGDHYSLTPILESLASLDPASLEAYSAVDFENALLRGVAKEMLDTDLWKLLWLPPSLPYIAPAGAFAGPAVQGATKKLVFSSWTATPTAIASLLSYEAERRIVEGSRLTENTADARKSVSSRLSWAMDGDRPGAMSTLALFWPHPGLAGAGDPLVLARAFRDLPTAEQVVTTFSTGRPTKRDVSDQAWQAYFAADGGIPAEVAIEQLAEGFATGGDPDDEVETVRSSAGLRAHIALAFETAASATVTHPSIGALATHGPGNIAYRALGRVRSTGDSSTAFGHWRAAAHLANGIRSLFSRYESMLLLDKLYDDARDQPYWQLVLQYCADGNLQAVMDEYVYQLRSETAGAPITDDLLMSLASLSSDAMTTRPSRYQARHLTERGRRIPFTARFALRYGGKQQDEESSRQPEIRNAFNSPFWPFVLASTSVGQEGIDFHWWCHSVLHWNVPSNPIDFEQREGRVNRFAGHAVRKNVAADHGEAARASDDPWSTAFESAAGSHPELEDFSPFWVYPGAAKIERQLATYPLSKDLQRIERLKESLTLYRLTLGQPRQQDMLELMAKRGVEAGDVAKLDLRPPRSPARRTG